MRRTLQAAAASVVLVSCACSGGGPTEARPAGRPNVVLVSLDALRADHLGVYGYGRGTSPTLDELAGHSVTFDFAAAQATWTLPSHSILLQSEDVNRVQAELPYLPEVLRERGYQTAAFVGGGFVSAHWGFDRGFDTFRECKAGLKQSVPAAREWLAARGPQPFFLFVHTYDTHVPFDPPEKFVSMYAHDYSGWVKPAETARIVRAVQGKKVPGFKKPPVLDEADRHYIADLYDATIRYADGWMSRLIDALHETGAWDNTVVFVISDHGEELWDHGSAGHGHTVYQELVRVPMIVHMPGDTQAGRRVAQPVMLLDFAPTVLELTGGAPVPEFRGTSFASLLAGGKERPGRRVVSRAKGLRALIELPYKLITGEPGGPLLFRLDTDPGEHHSLAAEEGERVAVMRAYLEKVYGNALYEDESPGEEAAPTQDPKVREQLRTLGYVN